MQRIYTCLPQRGVFVHPLHVLAPLGRCFHCLFRVALRFPVIGPPQIAVKVLARNLFSSSNFYNARRGVHHAAKLPVPACTRNCYVSRPTVVAGVTASPAEPLFRIFVAQLPTRRSGFEIRYLIVGKRRVDRINVGVRPKPFAKLYAVQHRTFPPRLDRNAGAAYTPYVQRIPNESKLPSRGCHLRCNTIHSRTCRAYSACTAKGSHTQMSRH